MLKKTEPMPQQNHLLAALLPAVQTRLFPHLQLVSLPLRELLYESNLPMRHVYFPTDSLISLQYMMENGESTATSVVGNEGLIGVNVFMGLETTSTRSLVLSAGFAYRLPRMVIAAEFERHGQLMKLMLNYTQTLLTQVSLTAACNRRHSIFQQLCRWLLISIDRLDYEHLTLTQEFISDMIGVRRESVTEAASKLRNLGVITYQRGMINVIDRTKLESLSCECYAVVKRESDLLLKYWPPKKTTLINIKAIPSVTLEKVI